MEGKPNGWEAIVGHLNDTSGWVAFDAKVPGVQAWKKPVDGTSVELVKAEGVIEGADAETLSQRVFSQTFEEKKKADETFLAEEVLEEAGPHSKVMYQAYAAPWPLSNRDLVFRRSMVVEEKCFTQVDYSEEHAKKPDPTGSNVRAHLMSMYRYEPCDGGCKVTYMVLMDPRGNIPAFVVNANTAKVPMRIEAMKKMI